MPLSDKRRPLYYVHAPSFLPSSWRTRTRARAPPPSVRPGERAGGRGLRPHHSLSSHSRPVFYVAPVSLSLPSVSQSPQKPCSTSKANSAAAAPVDGQGGLARILFLRQGRSSLRSTVRSFVRSFDRPFVGLSRKRKTTARAVVVVGRVGRPHNSNVLSAFYSLLALSFLPSFSL